MSQGAVDVVAGWTVDPVTGLLDREGALTWLEQRLASGERASVALVDLVETTAYGVRPAGSDPQTLAAVAEMLTRLAEPSGVAAHLSGDEFLVLVLTEDELALGRLLAERLGDTGMAPHVSVGTAPVRRGMTPSEVLHLANDAVCDAKLALTA